MRERGRPLPGHGPAGQATIAPAPQQLHQRRPTGAARPPPSLAAKLTRAGLDVARHGDPQRLLPYERRRQRSSIDPNEVAQRKHRLRLTSVTSCHTSADARADPLAHSVHQLRYLLGLRANARTVDLALQRTAQPRQLLVRTDGLLARTPKQTQHAPAAATQSPSSAAAYATATVQSLGANLARDEKNKL